MLYREFWVSHLKSEGSTNTFIALSPHMLGPLLTSAAYFLFRFE